MRYTALVMWNYFVAGKNGNHVESSYALSGEPLERVTMYRVVMYGGPLGPASRLPYDYESLRPRHGVPAWDFPGGWVLTEPEPFAEVWQRVERPNGLRGWRWVDGEWQRFWGGKRVA